MDIKVSQNTVAFDSEGYVYKQRVKIDRALFEDLKNKVQKERENNFPNKERYGLEFEFFLRELKEENSRVFLTGTQTRFIDLHLNLKLKNKNTYLFIQ